MLRVCLMKLLVGISEGYLMINLKIFVVVGFFFVVLIVVVLIVNVDILCESYYIEGVEVIGKVFFFMVLSC